MLMVLKRAEIIQSSLVSLIVAAAGIALLFTLLLSPIFSSYDEADVGSESYLQEFTKALAAAEAGNIGTFRIYSQLGKKTTPFYLIYFGNANVLEATIDGKTTSFVLKKSLRNAFCVCTLTEKKVSSCNHCSESLHPLRSIGSVGVSKSGIALSHEGPSVKIVKEGETYVISQGVAA